MLFIFPADPERTHMLTEEERKLAIARLYADQPSVRILFSILSICRAHRLDRHAIDVVLG